MILFVCVCVCVFYKRLSPVFKHAVSAMTLEKSAVISCYWHKAKFKKIIMPLLPLCFSIPSQFHLLAPRFPPLIKIPKSLRTTFLSDGRANNFCGTQPVFNNTLTNWLTDWLRSTGRLFFFFFWTEQQRSTLLPNLLLPHLLPPVCSIQTAARFLLQSGDLQVSFRGSQVVPQRPAEHFHFLVKSAQIVEQKLQTLQSQRQNLG